MKHKTLWALAAIAFATGAIAKLPAPDAAAKAKAKAAEAAAKTAWQAKADAYLLCKSQDKVAAKYGKPGAKAASAAASAPAPCADPGPFAYTPPEMAKTK